MLSGVTSMLSSQKNNERDIKLYSTVSEIMKTQIVV